MVNSDTVDVVGEALLDGMGVLVLSSFSQD
jgi:hypothetical protein